MLNIATRFCSFLLLIKSKQYTIFFEPYFNYIIKPEHLLGFFLKLRLSPGLRLERRYRASKALVLPLDDPGIMSFTDFYCRQLRFNLGKRRMFHSVKGLDKNLHCFR